MLGAMSQLPSETCKGRQQGLLILVAWMIWLASDRLSSLSSSWSFEMVGFLSLFLQQPRVNRSRAWRLQAGRCFVGLAPNFQTPVVHRVGCWLVGGLVGWLGGCEISWEVWDFVDGQAWRQEILSTFFHFSTPFGASRMSTCLNPEQFGSYASQLLVACTEAQPLKLWLQLCTGQSRFFGNIVLHRKANLFDTFLGKRISFEVVPAKACSFRQAQHLWWNISYKEIKKWMRSTEWGK